jgi:putative Mg2+ transporter-C (MgtC) family protein
MSLVEWLSIEPFSWSHIGTCLLCAIIIGLERQLRGKPVGIRTSALIVMGTYLFVAASISLNNDMTDTSRIIGQVVTGVGFLGAGVMLAKDGVVVGVTSAATIWALAGIGVCIAVTSEFVALKLSLVVVGILYGVDLLEDYSAVFTRGVHKKIHHWRDRGNQRDEKGPAAD